MAKFSHTSLKDYIFLFSFALLIRIIFLFQFQSVIIFDNPVVDMAYHHNWALAIANGKQFYAGPFFRAPLYPLFLGFVYWLFGESSWIIRIIQAVIGSVSCVLLYEIGRELFNRKTSVLASVIMALYAPLIFFDAQLLVPNLAIFLNLMALVFIVRTQTKNDLKSYLLSGLFLGLSAIARPTIGLFALMLIIYLVYINRKKMKTQLKKIALLVLCIFIPILPVTVYNYVQSSEITLIAAYGGINFYIGNYNGADGVSAVIPGVRPDWQGGKEDTKQIAEKELGRTLSEAEQSDYWFGKAIDDISDDPLRWVGLLIKKMGMLINGYELSNNFDFYYFAYQTTLMKILLHRSFLFFPFGLLFPFGFLGIFLLSKYERKHKILLLYLLAAAVSIILFLVTARYRLYMVPPLILFASYSIFYFKKNWRTISKLKIGIYGILFLALLTVCNADMYGYAKATNAHGLHTTATLYQKQGNIRKASEYYQKALDADYNQTETLNDYALLLTSQKKYEKAEKLLLHGLTLPNSNFMMRYNLGYLYLQIFQPENAKKQFKKVISERPNYIFAHNNLGLSYMWLGQLDSALMVYYNLIKIEPSFTESYYNAGLIWLDKKAADSAEFYFRNFLDHNPSNTPQIETSTHLLDSLEQ